MLRSVNDFPLQDADRSRCDSDVDREVLFEIGVAEPYLPDVDSWVRIPVRVSYNSSDGLRLELGLYDFSGDDLQLFVSAIQEILDIERLNG